MDRERDARRSGSWPGLVVVPAWSLWTEIIFYALLPFAARSKLTTVVWFAVGLIYAAWAFGSGSVVERYFVPMAGALPFSIGAIIYHFRTNSSGWAVLTASGVGLFVLIIGTALEFNYVVRMNLHFYLAYIAAALMVAGLAHIRAPNEQIRWLDARLGDLAYPIFLAHFTIGLALGFALDLQKSPELLAYALPATAVVALLLHRYVELPLNRLRAVIRPPPRPPDEFAIGLEQAVPASSARA